MSTLNTSTAIARVWSVFQQAIFDFIQFGDGNAIVEAVAGSGKTTTIVEALKRCTGSTIFLAFNKSIQEELKARGVNARTFHSLCFGPVMSAKRQSNPEMNKLRMLVREKFSFVESRLYGNFAQKMVGLARGVGIGCLVPDTDEQWIALADHHDIEPESDEADFGEAIAFSRKLMDLCLADPRVDFDDMLYFAVKDNIALPKFDFVFVDEAQDTNPIQRAIIRKIMHEGSRLVAVGDPAQAIYGFRGSDSESMLRIAEEFNAITLPLSISYRCPQAVVKYVQQWVPHIQAAPNAAEGEVRELGTKWTSDMFLAGDLVVCRKTAPLITTAFKFIRENRPVTVMGREIGQGLKTLIKKMDADNVDTLEAKLEGFLAREVEKLRVKEEDAKIEAITDRVETIIYMIGALKEGHRTLQGLDAGIDYLFANKADAIIFATIHKAKGLEARNVFWLGRSECPAVWARRDWQREQERNLCYVAGSRAMETLNLMELAR